MLNVRLLLLIYLGLPQEPWVIFTLVHSCYMLRASSLTWSLAQNCGRIVISKREIWFLDVVSKSRYFVCFVVNAVLSQCKDSTDLWGRTNAEQREEDRG